MTHEEETLVADDYAHHEIQEYHNTKIPLLLKLAYIILPIWGLATFYFYWDGSSGWGDRGYWRELQAASNTTHTTQLVEQVDQQMRLGEGAPQDK